jgi:hypothetical protein
MIKRYSKRLNYSRVLLAVYWLVDEEGLRCHATNAELSTLVGLSIERIRYYLRLMERNEVVATARIQDRLPRRTLVLLNHPRSSSYLERMGILTKPPRRDQHEASFSGAVGRPADCRA